MEQTEKIDIDNMEDADFDKGYNYYYGIEVPVNYYEAWIAFHKSAREKNNPYSNYMIGLMCENGLDIDMDSSSKNDNIMSLQNDERKIREYSNKDRANYYYEKSAYLGHYPAQYKMGEKYYNRKDPDLVNAYAWYLVSAATATSAILDGEAKERAELLEKELSRYDVYLGQWRAEKIFKDIEEKIEDYEKDLQKG